MVTAHTTMQYGHSAPMRYRLWKISQWMNTTPSSGADRQTRPVPPRQPRLLASASTPVTTTTVNATMPISGLGKPNADACGVTITEPHDSTGLMLQDGT